MVTEGPGASREKIARRQVDKFAERRDQLAAAALQALAEQGFANTSLRDIAQHSGFSHGVLHYYFADKSELLNYCVRQYKAECVKRYDSIVATSTSAGDLSRRVGQAMATTLRDDTAIHRLWYDLRNQSMFEQAFRPAAAEISQSLERMVWRITTRIAELSEIPLATTPDFAYALLDGLFQQALIRHLNGDPAAGDALEKNVQGVFAALLR